MDSIYYLGPLREHPRREYHYVPEGSTVLMEQPEIHLHPAVQSGLADVMLNVAGARNVRIILESHSEHLMRRLQRRVAENKVSSEEQHHV